MISLDNCCGKCYFWIWNGSPFFRTGYCSRSDWSYRREEQCCSFFLLDDGSNSLKSPEHYDREPEFIELELF